jgi:hypothetical protein
MAISVINEFDIEESGTSQDDIESGTVFVGTIEDSSGDDASGLFLMTNNGVVYLEDVDREFETDGNYNDLPKVRSYKAADVTITVDDTFEG